MSGEVSKYPEWRQAAEDFVAMSPRPGHVVTKSWLLERFCIEYPDVGTPEQIHKLDLKFLKYRAALFDQLMRDYQVQFSEFDSEVQGYRVLEANEVAKVVKRQSNAELRRAIARSRDRLAYTNLAALTREELHTHAELQVRITRKLQAFNEVDRAPVLPVSVPAQPPRVCGEQTLHDSATVRQ